MLARWYSTRPGRFLSQDRFASASQDLLLQSDPLTQNRYAFGGGNPVNTVEFDGHKASDCVYACPLGRAPTAEEKKKEKQFWKRRTAIEERSRETAENQPLVAVGEYYSGYDVELNAAQIVEREEERRLLRDVQRLAVPPEEPDDDGWFKDAVTWTLGLEDTGYIDMGGGRFVELVENGGGSGVSRVIGRITGADDSLQAVTKNAKRLGIEARTLWAAQRQAGRLASTLKRTIPANSRGRITMAVAVGRDKWGALRTVIATSERSSGGRYLRPGVREFVEDTRIPVAGGTGHAEVKALRWLEEQGLKPVSVAATRPICKDCVIAVGRSGATRASPWRKVPE